ncbi:MAG: hypothetical protein WD794_14105 [Mycobacteriales bacterium]
MTWLRHWTSSAGRRSARRPAGQPLPLSLPRPDGTGWPQEAGGPSFEASTYYELGSRRAYEPVAHDLAGRLVTGLLPHLRTGATPEDEPYLHKVFLTAARIGAGLGIVEHEATSSALGELDRNIAGALDQARRGLPAMREDWARTATWFLLAGHYLARQEPAAYDGVLAALVAQVQREDGL